ncbi:Eukaryotic RNA Recognition Motif (RRM) profile [Nakaseomyces glabratus]
MGTQHGNHSGPKRSPKRIRERCTVLVENVPKSYNQGKIKKFFKDCGDVLQVNSYESWREGNRCQMARVEFADEEGARSALTRTLRNMGSNTIEVNELKDSTVWMTNYPPTFQQRDIRNIFKDHKIVALNVRLPSLRFNSNRRFAYVDLPNMESLDKAIQLLNGKDINGYKLVVKKSNPENRDKRSDAPVLERREIIIRNLPKTMLVKDTLLDIFKKYGAIDDLRIPKKQLEMLSDLNHGCAFVVYTNPEDAKSALEMNNHVIDDIKISVNLSDSHAYLERKEVNRIINSKHTEKYAAIYPISDKTSKEQIRNFINDKNAVLVEELKNIYLVTDYKAVFLKFERESTAAKAMLQLNNSTFDRKTIKCTTIRELMNFSSVNTN